MSNKKGTELSMNTIIIAALAILVLIITAIFLMKGAKNTDTKLRCEEQSGKCLIKCDNEYPVVGPFQGCGANEKCCISMGLGTT